MTEGGFCPFFTDLYHISSSKPAPTFPWLKTPFLLSGNPSFDRLDKKSVKQENQVNVKKNTQ